MKGRGGRPEGLEGLEGGTGDPVGKDHFYGLLITRHIKEYRLLVVRM